METLKKHTFWKSALGSELLLHIIVPPESSLQCLAMKCVAENPKKYQARTILQTGDTTTDYHNVQDAKALVKEWVKYYASRLRVEFVQHIEVDLGPMVQLSQRKLRHRKSLPSIPNSGSEDESVESPRRLSWRFLSSSNSSTETSPRSKLSPRIVASANASPRTPRLTHAGSPRVAELKLDVMK